MALLLLLLVVVVTCFGLAGYGCGRLGRTGVRGAGQPVLLRCAAALLGAGAAAVYALGLLAVALAVVLTEDSGTDAFPAAPCRVGGDPDTARDVVAQRIEYLPPRYVCVRRGGGSYASDDVPGFVGPAALGFAVTSLTCLALAAREARRPTSGAGAVRTRG
ncbi:hypothetical protein [Streptomyces termitum]|uniref:hypothetical protein n=1 Tax=Streptomyces termitum TaxID=67368 RepID=UPI0033A1BD68